MSTKLSAISLTLERDGISCPWGFRLSGGYDLDQPLIITKVIIGSPSEGVLQTGDLIKKIGNYDARDLRHKDALNLFKNAGSSITVVVEREVPIQNGRQSRNMLPFIPQPPTPGAVATPFTVAGLPAYEKIEQSIHNNLCRFPPKLIDLPNSKRSSSASPHKFEIEQEPYRTTPLVLPGAKVNKDPAPTMSYLRHHPNPMMRSKPTEYEWVPAEIAKKQQLADTMLEKAIGNDLKTGKKVVAKQFNSPIGLYSEPNIANSVHAHTGGGFTPLKKTVVYDPSKSETYKALHESELGTSNNAHEVIIPVTRVFSPVKTPTKRASPQPHPTAPHPKVQYVKVIDYGVPPEEIHQSHSFKRLMNMVMTEY
ncbi:hypothetical protein PGB90_002329 [Kerria lacca]